MNMKFKTAMALALSAGLVLQAPVVALATEAPDGAVTISYSGDGSSTNNNEAVAQVSGTYTYNVITNINIDPDHEADGQSTDTALTITNTGNHDAEVNINNKTIDANKYVENEGIISLDTQGVAISTNQSTGTGSITVNAKNSSINGDVNNAGNSCINVTGGGVVGDISNAGTGDVTVNNGYIKGNVSNSGTGAVNVGQGDVTGNVSNSNNSGKVVVIGNVYNGTVSNSSSGTYIHDAVQDVDTNIVTDGVVIVTRNAETVSNNGGLVIVDGTVGNITGSYDGTKKIYVYELLTNKDNNDGNDFTGAHYIIKNTAGIGDIKNGATFVNEDVGLNYDYEHVINSIGYMDTDLSSNISRTYYRNYASEGSIITFTVADGYKLNNVNAKSLGNGRYWLYVPYGGGLTLSATWIQVIEDLIESETGEPAEIVTSDTTESSSSTEGITIISTASGDALPDKALGNATAATKTVSLDITKVTPVQYRELVQTTVASVPAGGVAVIETNQVATLDMKMIEAFSARPDVAVNIVFKHKGQKMRVVIPAGYDVKSLLDEHGYCGFLRLASILGFTILE